MIKPQRPPYRGTDVPPSQSLHQIEQLLLDYGCDAVQVTREATGRILIRFALEVEVHGVRRKLAIEIEPAMLTKNAIQGHSKITVPDAARSMRLAYWYLKSKLEAIAYGLVTAEREFFPQVVVQLPDGRAGTVGDIAEESIVKGGDLYLPGISSDNPRLKLPGGNP